MIATLGAMIVGAEVVVSVVGGTGSGTVEAGAGAGAGVREEGAAREDAGAFLVPRVVRGAAGGG